MEKSLTKRYALIFIILLGIVSLFSDMIYEGARSITGAYLAVLGANAAIVGFVAGLGEFIGYGLRFISGYLTERTQHYWIITITGYAVNLLAVPLLALAKHWWVAAGLIVLERFGKAIRVPARDAMLAHASENVGMGWGFGLHQAMDQIGAMLGPLIVAAVLYYHGNYRVGFAILLIPACLALITLAIAYKRYPDPHQLPIKKLSIDIHFQQRAFKYFLIGAAFIAAGYADFPLIAYHFETTNLLQPAWIPAIYGLAMGIDAMAASLLGWLYDRIGLCILIIGILLTAGFAPLVFWSGSKLFICFGVALWAVGMGVQDSLLRSIVGNMVPAAKRPSAYGLFNLVYGICWFTGSALLGLIYDHSLSLLVYFMLILQIIAIGYFIWVIKLNAKL